jgi:oligopeptide/dipeptide ABC transporter ATP-binding protein
LIVADEPVSSLDVSIQAQVINLLDYLRNEFNLTYVFISHDLSVVEHVCDRVAVMYVGRIVELAPTEVLNIAARHPYTRALLSSVPLPDPHSRVRPLFMEGDVPDPSNPPPGCAFEPRCRCAFERCSNERPPLKPLTSEHHLACWLNAGRGVEGENL